MATTRPTPRTDDLDPLLSLESDSYGDPDSTAEPEQDDPPAGSGTYPIPGSVDDETDGGQS